jgi:hypothetical protein
VAWIACFFAARFVASAYTRGLEGYLWINDVLFKDFAHHALQVTACPRPRLGDKLKSGLDGPLEQVTAQDFRLESQQGNRRVGATIDLVGPGKSSEAWQRTPEYQPWLKATNYALAAETPSQAGAFAILARDGREERKFDFLSLAVKAAASGDTIEVRGNGPFVTQPILIHDKALVLRAAEGSRPVIRLSSEAVQAFQILLQTNAPLVLEGLELQRLGLAAETEKSETQYPQLIRSDGQAPLHVANCRLVARFRGPHGGPNYERLVHSGKLVMQLHRWEEEHHHGRIGDPNDMPPGNGLLLWFEVDDIDAAIARAEALGAEVIMPRHKMPPSQM